MLLVIVGAPTTLQYFGPHVPTPAVVICSKMGNGFGQTQRMLWTRGV